MLSKDETQTHGRETGMSYQEITKGQFNEFASSIGFTQMVMPGRYEIVYGRRVILKSGPTRYSVVLFSSVSRETGVTRSVGSDAIRITLWDHEKGKPVAVDRRVNRTAGALDRTKLRARDMWQYVIDNRCPCCGHLMVERTVKATGGKFLGCSNFPVCKNTAEKKAA